MAERQSSIVWTVAPLYLPPPVDPLASDMLFSSPARAMADVWRERIEDLLLTRGLSEDWDGLGAAAPRPEFVDGAIQLLRELQSENELPAPSRVCPSPIGTVLLEWQIGDTYLEAEIIDAFRAEWMLQVGDQAAEHWESSWPPRPQSVQTASTTEPAEVAHEDELGLTWNRAA